MTRKTSPKVWQSTYLLNRALSRSISLAAETYLSNLHPDKLLDVGCGQMPYRILIDPLVGEYVGCDLYPTDDGVVECPADNLRFSDNSFDCVVCFQVLEHAPQPEAVVKEIERVLKINGLAILTVPFIFPFHASPSDYARFTHAGIADLTVRAGLEVLHVEAQCGAYQTLTMILLLKAREAFGGALRVPILRYPYRIAEGLIFSFLNCLASFMPSKPNLSRLRSYPLHANYLIVARKPEAVS